MMRLYGALILLMILSTACGLKCYACVSNHTDICTRVIVCPKILDRCFSLNVEGVYNKGCRKSLNCLKNMHCCEEDLCNSAIPSGASVLFLIVSSAFTMLFL